MDMLGLGEVVVDWVTTIKKFPEPDEKVDAISQSQFSGGVTANYTVAAARLGAKTEFIGAIGNDHYGEFLLNDFKLEGVYTPFLIKKPQPTPVNFICVSQETGEKMIYQSPYMHTTIPELEDFTFNDLNTAKVLHTTGIYPDLTLDFFKWAKSQNMKISFDLEKQIVVKNPTIVKKLLKHVDVLMPNKMGAMQLTNTPSPEEAAQILLKWGVPIVVITMGDQGAKIFTPNDTIQIPAFHVSVIDTTGAGDTFSAAFDFSYYKMGFPLERAGIIANAAAALKIQKLGARTGMPTRKELKVFLSDQFPDISQQL